MRRSTLATALVAVFISYLGTPAPVKAGGYDETDLVADVNPLTDKNGIKHQAVIVDPRLLNPWGIAESPASPFWVSNNGAWLSTLYQVPGANNAPISVNPLFVRIPAPNDLTGSSGTPTGAVFNIALGAGAFTITDGTHTAPAVFLFATEDGTIV